MTLSSPSLHPTVTDDQEYPPEASGANQILLPKIKRRQDSPCLEHVKLGAMEQPSSTMLTSKGKKMGLERIMGTHPEKMETG